MPPVPAGTHCIPAEPWQEQLQRVMSDPQTLVEQPRTPSDSPPPKRLVEEPGMMPRSKKHARSTAIKVETFEYA